MALSRPQQVRVQMFWHTVHITEETCILSKTACHMQAVVLRILFNSLLIEQSIHMQCTWADLEAVRACSFTMARAGLTGPASLRLSSSTTWLMSTMTPLVSSPSLQAQACIMRQWSGRQACGELLQRVRQCTHETKLHSRNRTLGLMR